MSIKKKAAAIFAAVLIGCTFACQNVCAKDILTHRGEEVRISPDANWIRAGGYNRYDGIQAERQEDALLMEKRLKQDGYIKLTELTDEQYEAFIDSEDTDWWFERYIHKDDKYSEFYSDEYFRIYVYKPSFDDWWKEYQSTKDVRAVSSVPRIEIDNSSVVIDYRYWWELGRVGMDLSDELNEGIPSWYDTGYVQIDTPMDVEVKFKLQNDNTYYTMYVSADTPFRCEMKYGNYRIEEINDTDLSDKRENIPLNNNIQVGWGDNLNIETPVEIDLTKTIEKYNIPPKDIGGKPDRSIDQNQNLTEEHTVVEDTPKKETPKKKKHNIFRCIIISLLAVSIIGIIAAYIYFRKKRG